MKIKFILLFITILLLHNSQIVIGQEVMTYESKELTTDSGSIYIHYIRIIPDQWDEGRRALITVGLQVLSFGNETEDFHDINLSIDQMGSCFNIGMIEEVNGYVECDKFVNLPNRPESTNDYLLEIYTNAEFREKQSFVEDPIVDDGFNFIVELTITNTDVTQKEQTSVNNDFNLNLSFETIIVIGIIFVVLIFILNSNKKENAISKISQQKFQNKKNIYSNSNQNFQQSYNNPEKLNFKDGFCTNCGKNFKTENIIFCTTCGTKRN